MSKNYPPMQHNLSRTCSIEQDGLSKTIKVRPFSSLPKVFTSLFMMLFWNGITSFFVFISAMATLKLLGFAIPAWVNETPINGEPGFPVSTGMVILSWIFWTPFIVVGLTMAASFFNTSCGSFQVIFNNHTITLSSGFWFLKYNRTLQRDQVTSIDIHRSFWLTNGRYSYAVAFYGAKEKHIGYGLSHDQLEWLEAVCRNELKL